MKIFKVINNNIIINVVRVGKNEGASIQASDIELFEDHSTFIVHYHDQSEKIWVPVQGEHNVFNALIAIAVGIELNISLEDIRVATQILNYAEDIFNTKVSDSKVIALSDHIHSALERYNSGIELKNNLLKFKGIGEHKAQICILKYMILQGKSIDIDDYDQMLNNCCSLDETLFREIEIIKKLSTKNII